MAWFSNGRKYWKHNGRIYSSRIKKRVSSSSSLFSNKKSEIIGPTFNEPKNFYVSDSNNKKYFIKKKYHIKTINNNINDFDYDYIEILEGNSGKYYYSSFNSKKGKYNTIYEIDKETAKKYINK